MGFVSLLFRWASGEIKYRSSCSWVSHMSSGVRWLRAQLCNFKKKKPQVTTECCSLFITRPESVTYQPPYRVCGEPNEEPFSSLLEQSSPRELAAPGRDATHEQGHFYHYLRTVSPGISVSRLLILLLVLFCQWKSAFCKFAFFKEGKSWSTGSG